MENNNNNRAAGWFLLGSFTTLLVLFLARQKRQPDQMSKKELEKLLKIHVEQENYEAAAVIRDMINNSKG